MSDDEGFIRQADSFLRSNGVISDFHKNNLVVTALCVCNFAKKVILELDMKSKKLVATLLVSRFSYWFKAKQKVKNNLLSVYRQYLPEYDVVINFSTKSILKN